MRRALVVAALLISSIASAEPLPLDLAFSRRDVLRAQRAVLSPDGRWFAYEIRTPLVKTPDTAGEAEPRFLPSGVPAVLAGISLWVADTRTGERREVCASGVRCWRSSWSPDSRQLAYYSDAGGQPGLWLYDVASGRTHRLGHAIVKPKLWPGDEARWSPDGKTIYVPLAPPPKPVGAPPRSEAQSGPAPGVTVYRTREEPQASGPPPSSAAAMNRFFLSENNASLAAIDVSSGEARILVPYDAAEHPNDLRPSPDGRFIAYTTVAQAKDARDSTASFDIVVLPAGGGDPVLTVPEMEMSDDVPSPMSEFRWLPDSRRIVYIKDHALRIAGISVAPRTLAEGVDLPLLLTADGKGIVVAAEKKKRTYDFEDPDALVLVPVDGGAPRTINVAGRALIEDDDHVWQPSPGVLFVRGGDGTIDRVDLAGGGTTRVRDGKARFEAVAANGEGIIARYETNSVPADFYLFDRNFAIVRRLSVAEPRLENVQVGRMESFTTTIPGYDGKRVEVSTHVLLPAGAKAGDRLPAVVYFYSGMPFSLFANDFGGGAPSSIPVQIFATRGYAVLLCDVPLGPEGKAGNPMQEMTDAIVAQVHRAAALGYCDLGRMAILGHSYGGYSTAAVITQTHLFRAAIALDGLYDLGAQYGWMFAGGENDFSWAETGQGRMGTHLWADQRRYIDNSPYYQADKIRTPLLLIHGEKDGACPVIEAKKMFSALKRLDRDAELAIYAGEGHVTGRWAIANAVDAAQRMLDFLGRHLGK
ncbi:MAG TPA: prolyl oligopeptidase family serine peptidase [Thermoanaerobaculia bacterium]|nr:prolyl oligopeptidase family serine peptidase [Thermoanaerobaculia bacterium]